MILVSHAKQDLKCLDEKSSLLSTNLNNFLFSASFQNQQGAYLSCDTNPGEFVCSCKVGARGFQARNREHEKSRTKRKAASNFYMMYMSN
jgi:hypothetical protein